MIDLITTGSNLALFDSFKKYPCSKQLHNYLPVYGLYLEPIRHSVKKVLEIGVETGDSLAMWEDYFPNAEIHGFDINEECKKFEGGRKIVHIGNQEKINDYKPMPNDFDVVIDDGSHITSHQIISFKHIFANRMKRRGLYFVEDCTNRPRTIDFFTQFCHSVNFWPEGLDEGKWPSVNDLSEWVDDPLHLNCIGVSFYRYLVVVQKGNNPGDAHANWRCMSEEQKEQIVKKRQEFFKGQKIVPRNL